MVVLRRLTEPGGKETPAGGEGRNSIDGLRRRFTAFLGGCIKVGGRFDAFGPGDSGGVRLSVVLLLTLLVSGKDKIPEEEAEKDRGRGSVCEEDGDADEEIISVRGVVGTGGVETDRLRSPRTIAVSESMISPVVVPDDLWSAAPSSASRCFAFL